MRSFVVTLAALCAAHASLAAQAAPVAHSYPAPPARAHGLAVHADYDAEFDKSILQLDPVPLDSTLALSALVALDGRVARKEASGVVLTFWSTAASTPYASSRQVSLQLDDRPPLALGPAFLTPAPRPGFSEVLMKSLSLDQWLALANASRATLVVGETHAALSADLLAAIRDFASRMAPGSGK